MSEGKVSRTNKIWLQLRRKTKWLELSGYLEKVTDGVSPQTWPVSTHYGSQIPLTSIPLYRDTFMLFLTLLTLTLSTILLWVELYLPKRYVVEVLILGICECIIWKWSITDVIPLKWSHIILGWSYTQLMVSVWGEGDFQTQGGR